MTRASSHDITPVIPARPAVPAVPLRIRGSPGDPAEEEGEAEMQPAEPAASSSGYGPAALPARPPEAEDESLALDEAEQQIEHDIAEAAVRAEGVPEADVPAVVRHRVKQAEMSTQATDTWDAPDWSRFDLGRALGVLRTGNDAAVKRVLQRLHIRNYHQAAEPLRKLLQAAGVSERVLKMVDSIVRGCRICNMWKRPTHRSAATGRLSTRFNEIVQADLLFHL